MHKTTLILLAGILILSLGITTSTVTAATTPITILEPQLLINHTQAIGNRTMRYYNVYVTLRNDGTQATDNITVFFTDPELKTNIILGNCTLVPGQTKTFTKIDYPLGIQGAFTFNVSFQPTLPIPASQYNTGKQSFTIGATAQKKSTPGFEWSLMAVALIVATAFYRRRR
jgi:hypothetical protein